MSKRKEQVEKAVKDIKLELNRKGSMNIRAYIVDSDIQNKLLRVAIRRVIKDRVGK